MNEDKENSTAVDDFKKWLVSQRKEALGVNKTPPSSSSSNQSTASLAIELAKSLAGEKSDSPISGDIKIQSAPANTQKSIGEIVDSLKKVGITNPYVQAGILGVISKESSFNHKSGEIHYKNTPNTRIREVYGDRVKGLSDSELDALKKDDVKFWDRVYGKDDPTGTSQQYGNTSPGDGLKYRGRGYNGLTFKSNYQRYSDLLKSIGSNVNLVSDPEILDRDSKVAADVVSLYFRDVLNNPVIKRKYGNKDHNDFSNLENATKAASNANAGPGTNIDKGIPKEGTQKALAFARGIDLDNLQTKA